MVGLAAFFGFLLKDFFLFWCYFFLINVTVCGGCLLGDGIQDANIVPMFVYGLAKTMVFVARDLFFLRSWSASFSC